MAPRLRSASALHNVLPEEALRAVMLALPADARARAACVCRSWRAFLADPSLWQVLDLTAAGGVAAEDVTENLVLGAVRRAAGQLRVFGLNYVPNVRAWLLNVFASDGAELHKVNVGFSLGVEDLRTVFAAAPRLQVLNTRLHGYSTTMLPFLRNDPPYGALQVSHLRVFLDREDAGDVLAFAAAVAAHESLKKLDLQHMHLAPGVNALVDAAAERRISWLTIEACELDAATVPALARLLQRGSLTRLEVTCHGFPHAQDESLPLLCAALHECRTLTHLRLLLNPPTGVSRRAVTELLDAAATLPALSELDLRGSYVQDLAAFGHALGWLLRANLPSLHTLDVSHCRLGDEGLAPLIDGLAANTHLRTLQCDMNWASDAFYDRQISALGALAARANLDA